MTYDRVEYSIEVLLKLSNLGVEGPASISTDWGDGPADIARNAQRSAEILRRLAPSILSAELTSAFYQLHYSIESLSVPPNGQNWAPKFVSASEIWHQIRDDAARCAFGLVQVERWVGVAPKQEIIDLPVMQTDQERIPNKEPLGRKMDHDYWAVWHAVEDASNLHGLTGPYNGAKNWHYGLADDHYNDELYIYPSIESSKHATAGYLTDVALALRGYPNYGGVYGYEDAGWAILFGDRVVVHGEAFASCIDLETVAQAMATLVAKDSDDCSDWF